MTDPPDSPPDPRQHTFAGSLYTAEVLLSSPDGQFWYYIVQPVGSSDIVSLERFDSYEEARDAAVVVLHRLEAKATASGE